LAAGHPATRWSVVLTDAHDQAIAVTHVPRSRSPGDHPNGAAEKAGLSGGSLSLLGPAKLLGPGKPGPDQHCEISAASGPAHKAQRTLGWRRSPAGRTTRRHGEPRKPKDVSSVTCGLAAARTKWRRTRTGRRRGSPNSWARGIRRAASAHAGA